MGHFSKYNIGLNVDEESVGASVDRNDGISKHLNRHRTLGFPSLADDVRLQCKMTPAQEVFRDV